MKRLVNAAEVARLVGVSKPAVTQAIRNGNFPKGTRIVHGPHQSTLLWEYAEARPFITAWRKRIANGVNKNGNKQNRNTK